MPKLFSFYGVLVNPANLVSACVGEDDKGAALFTMSYAQGAMTSIKLPADFHAATHAWLSLLEVMAKDGIVIL